MSRREAGRRAGAHRGAAERRRRPLAALRRRDLAPLGVFAWALLVHLVYLRGDLLLTRPVSAFFAGDGLHYLERARHLAEGTAFGADLPFHPPLTSWLLVPLWWVFDQPASVFAASKILMAAVNAAGYAVVYVLLRYRVPHAGPIALLLPLSFGELLLSSVANGEAIYRLLLLLLVVVGLRRPLLAGALHAAAALTRAEHLPFAVAALAVTLAAFPRWRRPALLAAAAAALLLAPYALATTADLRAFNAQHAAELPEPLPVWVPVSFYGPLNFALAQTEDEIFFSRRSLPVSEADAALDPRHPVHNDYIVHGYRIGLARIAADPLRFLRRGMAKLGFSLHALGSGWTWRDIPKGSSWIRRPVDLAYAPAFAWEAVALVVIALGAWRLRGEKTFLAAGAALLAYRLLVNVAFFPYLRGMAIVAPFWLALFWSGWAVPFRRYTRKVLVVALVLLGGYHLATGGLARNYRLSGERDTAGRILDDRTVTLEYAGFRHR